MPERVDRTERLLNLVICLMASPTAVPRAQIERQIPGYSEAATPSAFERMFERDKDELRRFGVLIETIPLPEGDADGYRLLARDFYLPYLSLMVEGRLSKPRKLDKYGYAALPTLSFEPDELEAVAHAAARARELGDPVLAEQAESAIRKLAVDLPLDAASPGDTRVAPARPSPDAEVFTALSAALHDRKRTAFDYRSMGTDVTSRRTVDPFGLFFLNQHWYLAGRTPGEEPVKNYRLSRITNPEVNRKQPGTRDYEIPADFRLREHARSKQAWELGDGDAVEAVVAFRRDEGAAMAAAKLGEAVPGYPDRRRFRVRRRDAFARWLLSFAGDVTPLSPPELVSEYDALIDATLAIYETGA